MDVDVVIVGLGPVGAVAANLVGQLGLTAMAVERSRSVYDLPRAAHFDGEIMRVFQGIGLADTVLPATRPVEGMHFLAADGRKLFGVDADGERTASGWPAGFMFYQPDLDRALRAGVDRWPTVEVLLEHEVEALRAGPGGSEVTVTGPAGRTVSARWVVGCDGARSSVRKSIDGTLDDLGLDQPWLVVDTMLRRPVGLPRVALQLCDPARPATFIPSAGNHRRWEFMLMPGETPVAMEAPARVWELLAPWVGPDDVEVIRAVVYSFHAVVAHEWRRGGVFLAGDAAHQMPPFLGQGMSAGIRDAANLAWKLAAVTRGEADDALLDTYQAEREPHVRAIIERAVAVGRFIQTTDPATARARDEMLAGGPLPDGGPGLSMPPIASGEGGAPAGYPLPQVLVHCGADTVLLDEVLGTGFATVAVAGDELRVTPAGRQPVFVREVGERRLAAWFGGHGAAEVTVRPDRYVGTVWRVTASTP